MCNLSRELALIAVVACVGLVWLGLMKRISSRSVLLPPQVFGIMRQFGGLCECHQELQRRPVLLLRNAARKTAKTMKAPDIQ
jgi:hypothetical protein